MMDSFFWDENLIHQLVNETNSDINKKDDDGITALMWVSLNYNDIDDKNIIHKLIENGADLNATDENDKIGRAHV